MIENFVVFIPFGLLLSTVFKKVIFWQKLVIIFVSSMVIETTQYLLAIGVSDITDVITNTTGGLVGLAAYSLCKDYINSKKIDRFITIFITLLIILSLLLRFFIFKVRY
jgi:glycopeptide antibiotics resistance protein